MGELMTAVKRVMELHYNALAIGFGSAQGGSKIGPRGNPKSGQGGKPKSGPKGKAKKSLEYPLSLI